MKRGMIELKNFLAGVLAGTLLVAMVLVLTGSPMPAQGFQALVLAGLAMTIMRTL